MSKPNQAQSEQLAALWTQAQPLVSAYLATLLPDFHQREEVLQRVAVTLVRKFDAYDQAKPFAPWAIGVARFEVLRHRRDFATDRHQFDTDIVEQVAGFYQNRQGELGVWRSAMRICVGKLEGRNKQVLNLRYSQGIGPDEIASQMKMTSGAVRALLHRVRAALRKCVQREATAEGGAL